MAAFSASPSESEESPLATASNILVLPLHVTEEPTTLHLAGSSALQQDQISLSGGDESLADLQPEPEEEGERRGGWEGLFEEQKKLEYMACLGLVPPAVLEEIHRRQDTCKSEYGNWWDRLHSTDFCLVPKSDSSLHSLHILNCEGGEEGAGQPPVVGDLSEGVRGEECEVVTQVAPRPDAGALVEQITYLTSWPQTTPPETANSVEIITQPGVGLVTERNNVTTSSSDEVVMSQTLREHYASILADQEQIGHHEQSGQLQSTFQHITTYR